MALLAGLGVALAMGAVNGICIGYLKMPPMVATFATSTIWYGAALLIMPQPGGYIPAGYYRLYMASLFDVIPVFSAHHRRRGADLAADQNAADIPFPVRDRRQRGFAAANGIDTAMTKLKAFLIAGVFIALAAFSVTAQTASGDAHVGDTFALTSIASIVIGGIALAGGRGTVAGAILGASSLSLLMNIIFFANIPSLLSEFIKGLIIIISLILSIIPGMRQARRQTIVKQ